MKQEQLKVALCGYLPYGVEFEVIEKGTFSNSPDSVIYVCADFNNAEHLMREKSYRRKSSKMVLFNISTLTKPIIVKGYNGGLPFVPIFELARLFHTVKPPTIEDYTNALDGGMYGLMCTCWHSVKEGRYSYFQMCGGEFIEHSEYRIVQMLNSWKIDYRNLIGQELAIDVETLKENCYE